MKFKSIILIILLTPFASFSQIDTNNYKQITFIKANQANDLFTYWYQSDRNYSDGVDVEVAHKIFNNKVSDFALLGFKNTKYKDFSLSINQDMFTPKNTKIAELDTTDRPYTALLYFIYAKYSNDFWKGRKLVSRAFIGVQGPTAYGEEAQNTVHKLIDNPTVNGWDNQLNNGLMLDYEVQYLHQLPLTSHLTELHAFAELHLGTIYNYTELGFRFKFGRYTDSYMNFYGIANSKNKYNFTVSDLDKMSTSRRKIIPKRIRQKSAQEQIDYVNNKLNRKFQFYFFTEGMINYMIYDGTVQGSLITFGENGYKFYYDDYEHVNLIARYGFVFQYSHFYMEYMRYIENDVYKIEDAFGYGRLVLAYVF